MTNSGCWGYIGWGFKPPKKTDRDSFDTDTLAEADEPRFSVKVWPIDGGWAWAVHKGLRLHTPGDLVAGAGAKTLASALDASAEWVRNYNSVRDEEIQTVLGIYRAYGRPLGVSGVLLGTAVVTPANENRVRLVVNEMERRGLLRVKYPAVGLDHEALYEINQGTA